MILSFNQLSTVGIVKDVNSELIPIEPMAWTEAQNIRFKDGSVRKIGGSEVLLTTPIVPYFMTRVAIDSSSFYLIGGATKFYVYYSGNYYNITRQTASVDVDYTVSTDNIWQSTELNGFPVMNNGVDVPQAWTTLNPSVKLTNLDAWPTNTRCAVMRSFKAYLLAGDITIDDDRYPARLMWSGAALPGGLPTTWDPADTTQDAGYIDLSDTPGAIIDMKVLGDNLIVYKQRATYILQYVGGNDIFVIKTQFLNIGAVASDCIAEVNGQHLVLTTDDIILTDGNSYKSIVDGRLRYYFFNSIAGDIVRRSFVVPNYRYSEIWVCVPINTTTYPNIAYIYNYETGVWSTRTLTQTPFIASGLLDIPNSGTFDSYNTTIFNNATFAYDKSKYNRITTLLASMDQTNSRITLLDSTVNLEIASNMSVILERKNIKLGDDESVKTVKRIWPKMTHNSGASQTVDFYVGSQMKRNDAITWYGPYTFNIVTGDKIDLFVTGRYISFKVQSNSDIDWTFENFELEIVSGGKW